MESFELTMKYRLLGFIVGPIFVLACLGMTIASIVFLVKDGGWMAIFGIACFFIFMAISIYGFICFLSYFEKISVENSVVTISIAGKERYKFNINEVKMCNMVFKENTKEAYKRVRVAVVAVVCGLSGSCFMYLNGESTLETIINYLSFFIGLSFIALLVLLTLRNKIVLLVDGNEKIVDINLFQDPDGIREAVKSKGIVIERMYF